MKPKGKGENKGKRYFLRKLWDNEKISKYIVGEEMK